MLQEVTDANGCRDTVSRSIDVGTNLVVGIAERRLKVWPVPAANRVEVQYDFEGRKQISLAIRNVLGQVMYETGVEAEEGFRTRIDVNGFPNGWYFLWLESEGGTFIRKIIIDR